jgi:hypothetical protein
MALALPMHRGTNANAALCKPTEQLKSSVVDYFTFVYQTCGLVFATGVNFYLGFW